MPVLTNLRSVREHKLMTQAELAAKSGVTQATISKLEQGRTARFITVRKLADALAVAPQELLVSGERGA